MEEKIVIKNIVLNCPVCNQPILIKDESGHSYGIDCFCAKEAKIKKFEKLSIIDRENSTNTFANAQPTSPIEKKFHKNFLRYVTDFHIVEERNIGLLFQGDAGVGKTFYANAICNELRKMGKTVLSFNLSSYLRRIREDFSVEEQLLRAVREADLVFIDDLGSEKLSQDWGLEKVFNLIDERYRAKKPILITTNLDNPGLFQQLKFNGSDKILDRIIGMTRSFHFDWPTKREEVDTTGFFEV